eukprot:jgi/Mesvir1/2523/Mv01491-RA.1
MRPKKSAIHEGVRALHRLAQKAMDAPEDTPQQRRQKARALSELLVPMMRVHQARTGSLFDDLDYYPPYVHAGYGAAPPASKYHPRKEPCTDDSSSISMVATTTTTREDHHASFRTEAPQVGTEARPPVSEEDGHAGED